MANKTSAIAKKAATSTSGLIAIIMTVATFMLVGSFLISKELVGDIRFNQKVISKKNAANATLKNNVDTLDELQSSFATLQKDGPAPSVVLQALPLTVDYPGLGAQYEAMAGSTGARLTNIAIEVSSGVSQPTATAESGGSFSSAAPVAAASDAVQQFNFRVTANGNYASLQKFTANIEKSLRPMRIVSVNITGSEPNLTADYVITSYFQPAALLELPKVVIQ